MTTNATWTGGWRSELAALVGWGIVGHLVAWMLALPVTALGPGAALMSLLLGSYLAIRDPRRIVQGLPIALLTTGTSLLAIRATVLSGFPKHQVLALQQALVSLLIGVVFGAIVIERKRRTDAAHRRSRQDL